MNNKDIVTAVHNVLNRHGYQKRSGGWNRSSADLLQIVNLQKSNFGMQYYVNLGFMPLDMLDDSSCSIKENQAELRVRMTSIMDENNDGIDAIFNLDINYEKEDRVKDIECAIEQLVSTFLDKLRTISDLKIAHSKGELKKFLITKEAQSIIKS